MNKQTEKPNDTNIDDPNKQSKNSDLINIDTEESKQSYNKDNIRNLNATKNDKFKKSDIVKFAIFVALIVVFIGVIIYFWPFFISLKDENTRMAWINNIRNMGFPGFIVALGIQIFQVVLAIIPGEPVEIAMGYLYGTFGGLGVCLLGIFIGSLIILLLVKVLGVGFVQKLLKKEHMDKLTFLHNARSLDTVVFILFFIPGTPKDMLTYFIPLTPMKPVRFLLISTFARIPSVITSTLVGASLGSNKLALSIVFFILTGIMGIIGIQINNWYMKKHNSTN